MKKVTKIMSILMLVVMMTSVAMPVFAQGVQIGGYDVNPSYTPNTDTSITFNKILGMIKYLGVFLAVGILMFLGIKYMMGSAAEKAEYKKTMIPFVVGVVLLFAAALIIQIIQTTTNTVITPGTGV